MSEFRGDYGKRKPCIQMEIQSFLRRIENYPLLLQKDNHSAVLKGN